MQPAAFLYIGVLIKNILSCIQLQVKVSSREIKLVNKKFRCVVVLLCNQRQIYISARKIKSGNQKCRCVVVLLCNQLHICFLREKNFVNRGNKIFVKEILVNRKYRCEVVLLSSQLRICASSGKIKCANLGCRCVIVLFCNRTHFYVSLSKILDQRRRW
jgi:hypothetical protein